MYGNGMLEKAYIVTYTKSGSSYKIADKLAVQFNASEYSIQRGARLSKKRHLGKDTTSTGTQTVHAEESSLTLSLYFDSYTKLKSSQGLFYAVTDAATSGVVAGITALQVAMTEDEAPTV